MATLTNSRVLWPISFLIAVCFLGIVQSTFAGTVVGWGAQPAAGTDPGVSLTIAGGRSYSLALRSDGAIVAWGDNL